MILDMSHLEMMTSSDASLAAEALGIFRNQADLWRRLLDPAAEPRQWADACHAIKGAANSVGLLALGEACLAAETLGRSGSPGPVETGVVLSAVKDRLGEALEAAALAEHQLAMGRGFRPLRVSTLAQGEPA